MDRPNKWWLLLLAGLATVPARAEDALATLGKQRAAGALLGWEVRETNHPVLGPIVFALSSPVATPVGNARLSSRVYVSCERSTALMAIELANATAPDDPTGLPPKSPPRLVCNLPAVTGEKRLVQEDLDARWLTNALGDVMARGLRPSMLRSCVSIGIVQDVALPKGWNRASAKVEFEIAPYDRALDSVFARCGEASAYSPAAPAPVPALTSTPVPASAPPARSPPAAKVAVAPPAPARTQPAQPAGNGWKTARTLRTGGRTNLRARPTTASPVVAELPPGVTVLVQPAGADWWRAKAPPGGARFEGYIRQDRLDFK